MHGLLGSSKEAPILYSVLLNKHVLGSQYPISQQESSALNFTSLSPVLHVGAEGHSLGLQSTAFASVQVHLWQLAVHISPGDFSSPSGP